MVYNMVSEQKGDIVVFSKASLEEVYGKWKEDVDGKRNYRVIQDVLKGLYPDIKDKIEAGKGLSFVYSKYVLYRIHAIRDFDYNHFSNNCRFTSLEDSYAKSSFFRKNKNRFYNMNFNLVMKNRMTLTTWDDKKEPEFQRKSIELIAKKHIEWEKRGGKGKISEIILLASRDEYVYNCMLERLPNKIEDKTITCLTANRM